MKIAQNTWRILKNHIQRSSDTLSFLNWFAICNVFIFLILCTPYLKAILSSETLFLTPAPSLVTAPERILMIFGLVTAYLGQTALLAYLPLILLVPLAILINQRRIIVMLTILVFTMSIILLIADVIVFLTFHFHINMVVLPLVSPTDLSNTEWLLIVVASLAIFATEIIIAYIVKHILMKRAKVAIRHLFVATWPVILLASYSTYITSAKTGLTMLAQQTATLPLYNQVLATLMRFSPWDINVARASETLFSQPELPTGRLFYPKHTLSFGSEKMPYNVVMIVVDAWRFDAFNATLTPHLYKFANHAWHFRNHISGGNCTEAGLTSLLYSMPHIYWKALRQAKRGAILVDSFQQQGYQSKVFFSSFMMPRFDQTAFIRIENLRTTLAPGKTIPDRDRTITKEWYEFIQHRDKQKPFFTFSLYDAAHGYCSEQNIERLYPDTGECHRLLMTGQGVKQVRNRYLNAVHFVDQQIGYILSKLEEEKLLDNTVVMITGDHGEEFHDTDLKYLGHSSSYSIFQTRVPLIVHWPKTKPAIWAHATSHYDIVPTLMKELLSCQNPLSDYSIGGKILWDTLTKKDYTLAGSYINSAFIERDRHTTLMTSGSIEINDIYGKHMKNATVNQQLLSQALNDFRWFYQAPRD